MSEPSLAQEFQGTERFRIVRRLGEGGMGVVYEVLDRERQSKVALKTMRAIDPDAMLGFKNEFRALCDIQHPNLVSLGELIGAGELWYFTMELVLGVDFLEYVSLARRELRTAKTRGRHETLRDPTIREPPRDFSHLPAAAPEEVEDGWPEPTGPPASERFEEKKVRSALLQLARGLDALHRAGKVHRDIKPSNVLVTEEDRLVILDFGLVVDASPDGAGETNLAGTVEYMSPEQAASKPVGPEADMYSVGVLLYEALTGQLPFEGTALDVMMDKQRKSPLPPRALVPGMPGDLDKLCMDLLRFDPRARPRAHDLIERLRVVPRRSALNVAPIPSIGPSSAFVGRQEELGLLRDAFAETTRGRSRVLVVHGESGVGKSALVRQFTYGLSGTFPPASVFEGRCYERESVPYKAFDGVIDALSRYLRGLTKHEADAILPDDIGLVADVFPVLRRVEVIVERTRDQKRSIDPQSQRSVFFAALRSLLHALAANRRVVVVIDDLQWADADSLALLDAVMRPPDAPQLLLLATVRTGSDGARTPEEIAERIPGEVQLVPITGLRPDEARTLTERLLSWGRAEGAAGAARIAEESHGHPLFIDALVRHALALGDHAPGALRLEDALWGSVMSLDAPARHLVEVVAVAGTPLRLDVAAQAAAVERTEATRLAQALRVAHLTRTSGGGAEEAIEPYHDRVRTSVLGRLDHSLRRDLHLRIALAMESSGRADPEALAIHFREAGRDDEAAENAAKAAARAVSAFAFERAASFYRMALALGAFEEERARELRTGLGTALAHSGRGPEAADAFLDAAIGAMAAAAMQLKQRAAEELLRSGRMDEGLKLTSTVLRDAGLQIPETPRRALTLLLLRRLQIRLRGYSFVPRDESQVSPNELTQIDACWSAAGFIGLVDAIRGSYFQAHHLLLALRAGEPYRIVRALAWEAVFWGSQGNKQRKRTEKVLSIARPLAEKTRAPAGVSAARVWLLGVESMVAYLSGRWKECVEKSEGVEAFYREQGWPTSFRELRNIQLFGLTAMGFQGALDRQRREVIHQLRAAEDCGNLVLATDLRTGAQTLAWLAVGDVTGARLELEKAQRQWTPQGFHTQHFRQLVSHVHIDLYVGDGAKAHQSVLAHWPALERSLLLRVQQVRIYAHDLRARSAIAAAARDHNRRDTLLREALSEARVLDREGADWSAPIAALVRGLVAAMRGDRRRAVDQLRVAIEGFDRVNMDLYAAASRRRLSDLLEGEEREALRAAWSAYMTRERIADPDRMTALIAGELDTPKMLTA